MREILFRGKRLDTNEWCEGNYIKFSDGNTMIINQHNSYLIDSKTLSEFTGYNDKNNTKIYEGDVTKEWILDELEEEGGYFNYNTVQNVNGCWVLMQVGYNYSKSDFPYDYIFLYDNNNDIEVIGNVHDDINLNDLI